MWGRWCGCDECFVLFTFRSVQSKNCTIRNNVNISEDKTYAVLVGKPAVLAGASIGATDAALLVS